MKRRPKLPNPHKLSPDFMSKAHESKLRTHQIFIRLNDQELDALKRYLALSKKKSRAAACREAIMEKVISVLENNQPTLF